MPTRRGLVTLVTALLLCALGMSVAMIEFVGAGLVLFGVLLVAMIGVWRPARRPHLDRWIEQRVFAGANLPVAIRERSPRLSTTFFVQESLPDRRTITGVIAPGPLRKSHRERVLRYDLEAVPRGSLALGPARISRRDLLGLFRRPLGQVAVESTIVWPSIVAVDRTTVALAVAAASVLHTDVEASGGSNEFSKRVPQRFRKLSPFDPGDLRSYRSGDDPRRIHWPATARVGKPMVRPSAQVHGPRPHFVADVSSSSHSAASLELALSATASVVEALLPASSDDPSGIESAAPRTRRSALTITIVDDEGPFRATDRESALDRLALVTHRPTITTDSRTRPAAALPLRAAGALLLTGPFSTLSQTSSKGNRTARRTGPGAVLVAVPASTGMHRPDPAVSQTAAARRSSTDIEHLHALADLPHALHRVASRVFSNVPADGPGTTVRPTTRIGSGT